MKKIFAMTAFILGLFALAGTAHAQLISWQFSSTDLNDDSDVANNGTAFDAATFYANTTVVNGVTFNPLKLSNAFQGGTGTTSSGHISITYDGIEIPTNGPYHLYGGPSTASAGYVNVVSTLSYVLYADTGTVSLSGLTVGDQYQVQLFAFDGFVGQQPYVATALSGSPAGMINPPGDAAGQYLVGDFTASLPTDSFTYTAATSGFGVINAVAIRDLGDPVVPEPSEAMLLSIGLLSLGILGASRRHFLGLV